MGECCEPDGYDRMFSKRFARRTARRYRRRGLSRSATALADIQESIEELRYYRDTVFVPLPGPDAEAAKVAAERHGGSITGLGPDKPNPQADTDSAGTA